MDPMHDIESGVWKDLFTHLIQIQTEKGVKYISELNQMYVSHWLKILWLNHYRYRCVATFGRGTIHKFKANVSEMKKLALRDFEDLLQVCISTSLLIGLNIRSVRCHASMG